MFIPGSIPTNTNLPTIMNHNLHQQQFLFDNLKDHRSNKLLSPMSRKTSGTSNFSLDPDLLRELNARYLHDINSTRTPSGTNSPIDGNGLPTFLLPPFLRAEHYHQHTHTHEHNLNILTPPNNSLLNGNLNNSLLDKLSKSDNSLSPFLRTANFSPSSLLPPPPPPPPPPPSAATVSAAPPIFPPFSLVNNSTGGSTPSTNNSTKEASSPTSKKSSKWCAAHVRISWMIYHQQQRAKDKLSPSDNKKDEEQQQQQQQQQSSLNHKLPDLITNTKPLLPPPPPSSSTSDLSLPLPSTYQTPLLPPTSFNYRSPFDFTSINNGPFGRVPPSSNTAFGGLGSLFPPPPPPPPPSAPPSSSSTMDRKSDINGSVAAAAALGLDWSRFHRGIGPSSLIPSLAPLSSTNDNLSLKKLDETNNCNNENKKRSSSVLNSNEDDRRNSHHHLMLPPSHLTNNNNNNYSSLNRSRSRSPHPTLHHHNHHSSNFSNKNSSSSPPLHSSSRKRNSPNVKSNNNNNNISDSSKTSHSLPGLPPVSLPPTFGAFDPLTLSIIERQRLSAAYASLFNSATNPQSNNYFPNNFDPSQFRNNNNNSSNIFPNLDSSAMTAALMQREHFLNSLRQQQEQIMERERAAAISSLNKISKQPKIEQLSPKINTEETPKVATSPGSHSSTSSSSLSSTSSSKKIKREKDSSSSSPPTIENSKIKLKEELPNESTST
ncbi:unnamed protein product [Adineta steineri]|uniref:Uncharacterized protein n=1 Tax=Adineta steineri TaxID=433720 RepID=A0A814ET31_9BILA|nr:unnamed protein product [Adineta steineri]CAF3566398.1 unnamed protein product [Adineta steineri]